MTGRVRRAGRFTDAEGRVVTWSVADGRRGRRWRWSIRQGGGGLLASHALETDPDGAFAKLESAAEDVLLTLHREADGSLHGNRVGGAGVEPIAIAAPAPRLVLAGPDPIALAAFAAGLPALAEALTIEVVVVSATLATSVATGRVVPEGRSTLRLELGGAAWAIELDGSGLPAEAAATTSWPLEAG